MKHNFSGSLNLNGPCVEITFMTGNVMFCCLDFKHQVVKAVWNLSLKADRKEFWRSTCLLCVNLQFYPSWRMLLDTVTLSHLQHFIDSCNPLPNLSLFLHNFWLSLLGHVSVKLRNTDWGRQVMYSTQAHCCSLIWMKA